MLVKFINIIIPSTSQKVKCYKWLIDGGESDRVSKGRSRNTLKNMQLKYISKNKKRHDRVSASDERITTVVIIRASFHPRASSKLVPLFAGFLTTLVR